MTKRQNITIGAIGYALIGLIAFGHCAAGRKELERQCLEIPAHAPDQCGKAAPIAGLFAGVLWPLYLSWELQS